MVGVSVVLDLEDHTIKSVMSVLNDTTLLGKVFSVQEYFLLRTIRFVYL